MNVFVLCTGRCGSTTFVQACRHMVNYTAAHESRTQYVGSERFAYPDNHIEADNRLSWHLGRLDAAYNTAAVYIHLKRNTLDTARSFLKRWDRGIISAYYRVILSRLEWRTLDRNQQLNVCIDYCNTVNANIALFLKGKPQVMTFHLERAVDDFRAFWDLIGAEGERDLALKEWSIVYNRS